MRACVNNDQRSFVLEKTFAPLCAELSLTVRGKDHTETASIVETMAEMIPSMSQEQASKLPEMMQAVLALVRSLSNEV